VFKDSAVFQVLKQNLYTSLINKGKDPGSVFGDSVSYIMSNYHPRRRPLTIDRIDELKLDQAFNVYQDRFADASDFLFTFVGNFNVDSISPYIEKYIAGLPNRGRKENFHDNGVRYPTGVINKEIRKGKENKATVRISYTGITEYSDLEVTQLDQLAKILEIPLREQMREEQGGVYGVNVSAGINREPVNAYYVNISFTCAPANVERLTAVVNEEISKLKQNGAMQANVDKIIAEDTRSIQTQVKENGYWLYNLEQKYYHHENPVELLPNVGLVKKINVATTKELANKYFSNNMVKIVLLPE